MNLLPCFKYGLYHHSSIVLFINNFIQTTFPLLVLFQEAFRHLSFLSFFHFMTFLFIEMSENSYLLSHEASSLKSLGPKSSSSSSSENVAHKLGPFEPNTLSGGVSAVRQTSIHSRSLHQSWNSGTSTSKILSQPGVIAGKHLIS